MFNTKFLFETRVFQTSCVLFFVVILVSCSDSNPQTNFYHWKSKVVYSDLSKRALEMTHSKKLYLHYFDVDVVKGQRIEENIFPEYVVREVDDEFKDMEIVPVVFISNRTLEQFSTEKLPTQISKLIDQISIHHFDRKMDEIQIDCDWNNSTREAYFRILKSLEKQYRVTATLRLHQLKYPEKTGVPPVDKVTLMLYNMGDLKKNDENSILDAELVGQYVNGQTDYPLAMDLALPLYSQLVIKNLENKIRISNGVNREEFESDIFELTSPNNILVKGDTLFRGFYLTDGFQIKIDEVTAQEVMDSYTILKNSKLEFEEILFYHLDGKILDVNLLEKILKEL